MRQGISLLIVSIGIMLFMTACTPLPDDLIFYNNTQSDIWITFLHEEHKESYLLKSKEKLEIEDCMGRYVSISCNDNATQINYEVEYLPREYRASFQIEPDWNIYILKDENFPAKEFPPQPEGYPLKPVSKTVSQQSENIADSKK